MQKTNSVNQSFVALTGLRGVGAVWVVVFHTWDDSPARLVSAGYLGVDLFFVLSGFIITHVHGSDFETPTWKEYGRFLALRIVRIFPLHAVVLSCFALFAFSAPGFIERYNAPQRWDIRSLLQTFMLVNNWFRWPPLWNHPSWSLSAEWLGYLAFPAIMLGSIGFRSSRHFFLATLCSVSLMVVAFCLVDDPLFSNAGTSGVIRMAGGFTAGCMPYRYFQTAQKPNKHLTTWGACTLIASGIAFEEFRFLVLFGFAFLILGVVTEDTLVRRLVSIKPVILLGDISFSIYLCHWPLLQIRNWCVARHFVSEQLSLVSVFLAIGFTSYVCWKYIEVPARKWDRSRLARRAG